MKIIGNKISFFSTLNQYFPHIPYVASKKETFGQMTFRSNGHFSKKAFGQMNFRSN
jgi:hypothetical protein